MLRPNQWLALSAIGIALQAPLAADNDPKADALIARAQAVTARSKGLSADLEWTSKWQGEETKRTGVLRSVKAARNSSKAGPDSPRVLGTLFLRNEGEPHEERLVSDGKRVVRQLAARREYEVVSESHFLSVAGFPVVCFYSPATWDLLVDRKYAGRKVIGKDTYEVVKAAQPDCAGQKHAYTLTSGRAGYLRDTKPVTSWRTNRWHTPPG